MVTFAELSGVPFKLTACSETCLEALMEKYGEMNIQLQKDLDKAYQESIEQALKEAKENGGIDLGPAPATYTPPSPWDTMYSSRHLARRKKRCSIM